MNFKKSSHLIAIHNQINSFSQRWIEICQERGIPFKIVNAYTMTILKELEDADIFLWHWSNREPAGLMFARSIIQSAEAAGVTVFPNTPTCWHYDDKVAQWFLLTAIGAPTVETYFFLSRNEAMDWIEKTSFPKVFKLRSGSGSRMVKLVDGREKARELCDQAFSQGFDAAEKLLNDAFLKLKSLKTKDKFLRFVKKLPRAFNNWRERKKMPRERGYFYLQEFLANNEYDTRITIIGNRAFAFRRHIRENDFRASGSGMIDHNQKVIDLRCVQIAQNVTHQLETQSLAFDFLFDSTGNPKIVEISYAFQAEAVHNCPGFWDNNMNWNEGHVWPQDAILEDILAV